MNQGVFLFHTTSAALRAEKVLTKAGFEVKLVPTPRELSSDCGIALRFEWSDRAQVEVGLAQAGLEGDIHSL
ncbi:MAG: DUF3343 domain-containing protein [Anaerolineaceae bacterium]|nr:DUF3343 domain-containing protein [Anaerolineaceae bacterium]